MIQRAASFSAFGAALAIAAPVAANAQVTAPPTPPRCAPKPFRWQEDCRNLAGADLDGLARLRYAPLNDEGSVWLSLGGEARARMDLLHDADFGINGAAGYTEVSGRLLLHADLRTAAGPRAFLQFGIAQETGREPGPRGQDESAPDVTQAFVDLPLATASAQFNLRLGRQELDLSGNRLVNSRDGSTLRRTFEGVRADLLVSGARVSVMSTRPMELRDAAFSDRADDTERFRALSVDAPHALTGKGLLNVFVLDRKRDDARYLRARGEEHRYSFGARYGGPWRAWTVDAQATLQRGRVHGLPVRAYSIGLSMDRPVDTPWESAVGIDVVATSGDHGRTRRIETFDPTYPNNGGLSDAPLFYQTNYIFAGGSYSVVWRGAIWSVQSNLLARHSTSDAVYAQGRPIAADFGDGRLTSLLSQVSVRKVFSPQYEAYASLVKADALTSLHAAHGRDAIYSRIQLTARF